MSQLYSLPEYGVIEISGDDRISYLQGQFTCDMTQLAELGSLAGCHCDAKGKMWSNFVLSQDSDRILMVLRKSILAPCLAALQKFAVFAKAEIKDVSDDWQVSGSLSPIDLAGAIQIPTVENCALILTSDFIATEVNNTAWFIHHIEQVWPELEHPDMVSEFVPQMLNQADLNAVNFKKGCYIGQETIARMQYLGKQKRATFYLKGPGCNIHAGDTVEVNRNGNWRRAGQVVNAVSGEDGTQHVLAVLPADSATDEVFRAAEKVNSQLALQALPYPLSTLEQS
ncbi:YgfZ/GcvT domain-containing protein [Echinimonas agarilytica]|uniref:tRNA-modifying protein YgfZ-like beta-barrel domain-containing protein n=1 Tax=Echinimonas agarilytica TaxID=1215918 RepID=A0AA41W5A9_9GAMM|nr:hypothetical protein [Echinimonas agarilytica]MCM2678812.1 hypothetical protein [Echinimonas agarilytica]